MTLTFWRLGAGGAVGASAAAPAAAAVGRGRVRLIVASCAARSSSFFCTAPMPPPAAATAAAASTPAAGATMEGWSVPSTTVNARWAAERSPSSGIFSMVKSTMTPAWTTFLNCIALMALWIWSCRYSRNFLTHAFRMATGQFMSLARTSSFLIDTVR